MNKLFQIVDNHTQIGNRVWQFANEIIPNLDCKRINNINLSDYDLAESFNEFYNKIISQLKILFVTVDLGWNVEELLTPIRAYNKEVFLVYVYRSEVPAEKLYIDALVLCKKTSCNLILATNYETHMVVAPEEAAYHISSDLLITLRGLVEMAKLRSHLTFTQSTVVAGDLIPWNSDLVPHSLRTVVNYCIEQSAYRTVNGVTAGHFAVKVNDNTFLTSIRKTNFNKLPEVGLVKVVTDGPDTVLAYGAKPSVGGQSQRIVFRDHPGMDCILHFHSPIRLNSEVPVRSQRETQCGSHECGTNTSLGLKQFGNLEAVYLDNHGPNIVFNRDINPQEVIDFIENNFDLSMKTGGYQITES